MSSTRPGVVGLITIAVVGAASAGAAAALAMGSATPRTLAEAPESVAVPVSTSPFSDDRPVQLVVDVVPDIPLSATGSGRITSIDCSPGGRWESGKVSMAVDGLSVVALATATPLWRDLAVGDRGDDVAALEQELSRLGSDLRVDGVVTRATVSAVAGLLGPGEDTGTISSSRILWIPHPTTELASCTVFPGSPLAAGEVVAFARQIPVVAFAELPTGLVAGSRVLRVEGTDIPLLEDGALDAAAGSAITGTSAYRAALAEGGPRFELAALLVLAEPALVASVPPAAIYGLDGRNGCVLAPAGALPVTVVGSQLGKTYVEFPDGPPETVETPAHGGAPCR